MLKRLIAKARVLLTSPRAPGHPSNAGIEYSYRPIERIDQLPASSSWATLISAEPLIIGAWPTPGLPMGMASAIGPLLHRRAADFLMFPSWAWELPHLSRRLMADAAAYRKALPLHRFTFVCNTPGQEAIFAKAGWPALTCNWNFMIDDAIFRPLPGSAPQFDAVYNARLSPGKRHELAAELESLCLIYFRDTGEQSPVQFHAQHARLSALLPKAIFLNTLTPDGCEFLPAEEVNRIYNQARVGLCLSAVEGQMRASMEYMLAGLPLVSTRSVGGRDYFFDDEFCVVVRDDPRAVRDATRALIARDIPRALVRAKTMDRIGRERERFIAFVQELIDRGGGRLDFAASFPKLLAEGRLTPWLSAADFAGLVLRAPTDAGSPVGF